MYLAKQPKKKKNSFLAVVKLAPYPARMIDMLEAEVADIAGLTYHDNMLYTVDTQYMSLSKIKDKEFSQITVDKYPLIYYYTTIAQWIKYN